MTFFQFLNNIYGNVKFDLSKEGTSSIITPLGLNCNRSVILGEFPGDKRNYTEFLNNNIRFETTENDKFHVVILP